MSFQKQVYINPAVAVAGDFASSNPMIYKLSSNGRMVADANGVTVGKFALLTTGGLVSSLSATAPDVHRIGFVHRENNAQITTYLAESGNTIQAGQAVALFGKGDFYVKADVVGTSGYGQPIYWDSSTGQTIVGAPGTPTATQVDTGFKNLFDGTTVAGQLIPISNIGA